MSFWIFYSLLTVGLGAWLAAKSGKRIYENGFLYIVGYFAWCFLVYFVLRTTGLEPWLEYWLIANWIAVFNIEATNCRRFRSGSCTQQITCWPLHIVGDTGSVTTALHFRGRCLLQYGQASTGAFAKGNWIKDGIVLNVVGRCFENTILLIFLIS